MAGLDHNEDDKTRTHVVLTKGTMVSHYRIIKKIGAGGMGEVYLAEDTGLHREVALKFLPAQFAADTDFKARFVREAEATAKLDHPNIVTIFEVSEFRGRPFFAMQHVEGQSLRDHAKAKELEIDQVVNLAIQLCDGLNAAHEKKVVHRDIKPSNIVIDAYGRPKILDFGLATIQGGEHLTKTGSTLGTVQYMSPEQVKGKEVDHRSDLFSLGVVLYELITSHSPFSRDNDMATGQAIVSDTPDPMAKYRANIPEPVQAIISKLLEKDPNLRYQTAAGVLPDLRKLRRKSDSDTAAYMPIRKRGWGLISAAAAAVCVVAVIAGYFLIGDRLARDGDDSDQEVSPRWTNSIAVLPFRDFSTNKDQEQFCYGMTDAIIGKLSGINGLKVISMTSVMRYRGTDKTLKAIGQELEVNTILEGSLQREGDAIRVQAQLIKAADDAHLWSDQYNRELKSVFAIQDDISRSIVDAMKIELLDEDVSAISRRGTENVEAYNLYTHGRFLWSKRIEADLRKSIKYFERAIALDSNYALAWSGLADAWSVLPGYSFEPDSVIAPLALEAARRAIGIDGSLAEAHASLGLALHYRSSSRESERSYLRAIEINPGYVWTHIWYSLLLNDFLLRPRDAIDEQDIAFALDPMSIPLLTNRAQRKSWATENEEAEELFQRLIEIEPDNPGAHVAYSAHLYITSRCEEALAQAKFAAELQSDWPWPRINLVNSLNVMGRYDEAIRWALELAEINPEGYNKLWDTYTRAGKRDSAFWAVGKYVELDPGNSNVYDSKGQVYAYYGMVDSAIQFYQRALEINSERLNSTERLGCLYILQQEYDKAKSLFHDATSGFGPTGHGRMRWWLSRIPAHQGRFEEAMRILDEGIKTDRLELGDCWPEANKWSTKAAISIWPLRDCASGLESQAEQIGVWERMGRMDQTVFGSIAQRGTDALANIRKGEVNRADRLIRQLENEFDSTDFRTIDSYLSWLGFCEMERGNYDSAAALFEANIRLSPDFILFQFLGIAQLEAGRISEAVATLEKAASTYDYFRFQWPEKDVLNHYYLGQAYEAAGRKARAIEQYETFLDIWKNADEGLESVEDAKERLANLKHGT